MLLTAFALAVAAAFAGAAFYINAVEQPARLNLTDRALLEEWKIAYERGTIMQASLALIGFALGLAAWWIEHQPLALLGAVLILLPWPITVLVIMPTNNILEHTTESNAGAESRALIRKWGRLHALRTLASLAACAFFISAIAS
jgi:uncharacterized membrane protein